MASIPDFPYGGMENWGLIFYAMDALLYDPVLSSSYSQQHVAEVITHELAHQWFGNLVTLEWWNDIWLNEGFASYAKDLGVNFFRSDWQMREQFVLDTVQRALRIDSLRATHPVTTNSIHEDPRKSKFLYAPIPPIKGASLILMLENFVGLSVLQEGITRYLNRYQYDNAATTNLWNSFGEVMDSSLQINISTLMGTWTWQKGFPLLVVSCEGGALYVKQQRFVVTLPEHGERFEQNASYNYQWHIPITFITDKSAEVQKVLLSTVNGTITVGEDTKWVKLNVNQTGLYRVMYEENEWRTFTEVLHQDHLKLHARDRANLLDDGFSLARIGLLNSSIVLDMANYLQKEIHYVPWATAFSHFRELSFLLHNTTVYPLFQRYVVELLHLLVVFLGQKDEGSHLTKKLRSLALTEALHFGDKEVIAECKKLYDSWKNNGTWIAPNLQKSVYIAGIIGGGSEEWQYLWDYLQNSTIPSERSLLLDVLSTSKSTVQLKRFLAYSLDSTKINPQDKYKVIRRVANQPIGHHLARNFLFNNWKVFFGRATINTQISVLRKVISYVNSYSEYGEVNSFFQSRNLTSHHQAVEQSKEQIQANLYWHEKVKPTVVTWFNQNISK